MKNILTDYPLSTISSVALSFNWHILEPVVVQLGFLLVEFLRQKYIKRRRMSKIRENGNLEGKE
ncbi:hypothetical protein CMU09_15315 [Elizabethkingia anophelis]|uniref:hypothetical protein n=1 Tax=Elizabethkingia anophelis TaxID=1117645 RepID=UPI002011BEB6|nr:hypothetical protein [Elizabethkingia anophelis]MDV3813412.1 hypothetical protein [Elizabethkingia anophelis]MDV4007797.1 hypothetical protein [Elizabethkingia anophelis]MDV4022287.1 hypothetical protein [Elizabethkingia anophelis]WBS71392.1 hypothetical protein PF435_00745 [Elizabethkingia anophelis]